LKRLFIFLVRSSARAMAAMTSMVMNLGLRRNSKKSGLASRPCLRSLPKLPAWGLVLLLGYGQNRQADKNGKCCEMRN
jgi:hypothetical protein